MQLLSTKPLLVYDNDCQFCKYWITQWQHITKDRIEYRSYQEVASLYPKIPLSSFQASVHLIYHNGPTYTGAEAVLRALDKSALLWCYTYLKIFAIICDNTYNFIAKHRDIFSKITRWLWGTHTERETFLFSRWVFLRGLGGIYFIAFVSMWVQIHGLVGTNGILPANLYLTNIYQQIGVKAYHLAPTLFWVNATDLSLHLLCAAGVVLSIVLITGYLPTICLTSLWILYLSFVTIGQVFLSFQWDVLLLETGFLAILIAPLHLRDSLKQTAQKQPKFLWLLRWLLFRLMFASGYIKIVSDKTWRNLTALNFHYETQPLPTWIGWYTHQLPEWFQKLSVIGMFGIELVVPFLIFAPRRLRTVGSYALIGLQILILLTGNYCFFNLLTILLCLILIDDITWKTLIPKRFIPDIHVENVSPRKIGKICLVSIAIILFLFSSIRFTGQLFPQTKISDIAWKKPFQWVTPFYFANTYGLFANMTESRPEIIIEGSNDQITWIPYKFRWKPGELTEKPKWVAPHQPRLDWQMWFAALQGNVRNTPWFLNLMESLLRGKPEVIKLLSENPFPNTPPRYLRANLYDYRFTDIKTKNSSGNWWRREFIGEYCPIISLR